MHRKNAIDEKNRKKHLRFIVAVISLLVIYALAYVAFILLPRESTVPLNQGSGPVVITTPELIPDYSGEDCFIINNGIPGFTNEDLENIKGEQYTELDSLGRCGTAVALLDASMMPTEKRGDISEVKPSGYKQAQYEGIIEFDPPYLYNRSHLIAYALTGQNANEKNLITGTHHMNSESMLYWENQVIRFLHDSDYHVLYRVTPYFKGKELVARGVEMEAYSVEDKGSSICFHVFVYNVQPEVEIDYKTGESKTAE